MTRETRQQWGMMVGLIAGTVGLRIYFQHIPNFAPVAAVAMFAGFYFRARWMALAVPLTAMWITDRLLGGYQPALMVTVYGLLTLPILMRSWLRDGFDLQRRSPLAATVGLVGCTLLASLLFFVATNLMTWIVTPWYPRTTEGLLRCFVSAVPFFRFTLAGDMIFATSLFGGYAIVRSLMTRQSGQFDRQPGSGLELR